VPPIAGLERTIDVASPLRGKANDAYTDHGWQEPFNNEGDRQ
jgi:hypothetical protein